MKISKMNESKDEKEFMKNAKEYARETGIRLNPNKKIVEEIVKGLFKNKREKGEFYCPCRIVSGNKEKDKEIICPCVFHKKEIERDGHCKCFLFVEKK